MAPDGGDGTGALGGGLSAGDGASSGAAADAAAATGLASTEAAAASPSESSALTAAGESASSESTPSLLSSAAGKSPGEPAPAADVTQAKAADASDGQKPGEAPAKPDDPGKAKEAEAQTDPAAKDATAPDPQKGQPPAPLSIDDLKLPDGVSLDGEAGKAFVDTLNNAELSGKDRGQALIDLHRKEMDRVAKHYSDHQTKVWQDLNAGWKNDLRNDKELGGNRLDTSLSMAKATVEEFLSPQEAAALFKHADLNGMGNFPPFIRLLHNIGKRLNVFEDGMVASNPSQTAVKGPGKRGWYDKTPGMNGSAP